jgi:hypothetical protein
MANFLGLIWRNLGKTGKLENRKPSEYNADRVLGRFVSSSRVSKETGCQMGQ